MNINLLMVDPQNCFTQPAQINGNANPLAGTLFVPNADADMIRLAGFITQYNQVIDSMVITGDFHPTVMISFPNYWVDVNGNNPVPFTVITVEDVETGVWKTANPDNQDWGLYYVRQIAENNKTKANNFFDLRIWPYHAVAGTTGCNFDPVLMDAVAPYLDTKVTIVMKGLNPHTEQQGALEADVPVPGDVETVKNTQLVKWLDEAITNGGDILITGEAQDICLAYTVYSILSYIPLAMHNRIVLLSDCMSPIYPDLGEKFFNDMITKYNIRISNSVEYFC